MTQNKHKATHDQLKETKMPLSEAWHSLLQWFSWVRHWSASYFLLFFWHTRTLIHMLRSTHFYPTVISESGTVSPFNEKVKSTNSPVSKSCPAFCHYLECSFLGVPCFLVCHRWLAIVMASTLADMVLAGIWLNCFLSELYLYRPSIILVVILLGPIPASLVISSVSGQ